jgi:hypothetical protein
MRLLIAANMTKLRKTMFNTFYAWIFAHHSLFVSSFADFLNFCSSFSSD